MMWYFYLYIKGIFWKIHLTPKLKLSSDIQVYFHIIAVVLIENMQIWKYDIIRFE